MRIEQLQLIIEIANTGSLTAAAEKLNLSQPTASLSLSTLEDELNMQIFSRSRSGTLPTELGLCVIDKAREILLLANDIKTLSTIDNTLFDGKLSIAAIPSICKTILPNTIYAFKKKFPNVQIDVLETDTMLIENTILNSECDIAIVSYEQRTSFSKLLAFRTLLHTQTMACVSKLSPLANWKKLSYANIIEKPLIIPYNNNKLHDRIISELSRFGTPNILLKTTNAASTKNMIVENLAIGFDSAISLKKDPYTLSGDIVPVYIMEEPIIPIGILYQKKTLSAASKEFIKELQLQADHFSRLYNLD